MSQPRRLFQALMKILPLDARVPGPLLIVAPDLITLDLTLGLISVALDSLIPALIIAMSLVVPTFPP